MIKIIKNSVSLLIAGALSLGAFCGCSRGLSEQTITSSESPLEEISNESSDTSVTSETTSLPDESSEESSREESEKSKQEESSIESSKHIIESSQEDSVISVPVSDPEESSFNIYDLLPVNEIALFGDSIAAGYGCDIPYIVDIYNMAGIKMYNCAVSGSGYVWNVAKGRSVVVGNGTIAKGEYQTINYDTNLVSVISNEAIYLPQDVIAIAAGTNDFAYGQSITDFEYAVRQCIEILLDNNKVPVIISPVRRELKTNALNLTLDDYVYVLQKVCNEFNVPYIDIYNIGIDPNDPEDKASYYLETNKKSLALHPNDNGHQIIAEEILKQMRNIGIV